MKGAAQDQQLSHANGSAIWIEWRTYFPIEDDKRSNTAQVAQSVGRIAVPHVTRRFIRQLSPRSFSRATALHSVHVRSTARFFLPLSQLTLVHYSGIYLRDLVYIESTNAPEEVKVPDGIQFKQKKQVFSVIKLLQTYQEHPYAFEPNDELIQMLNTLPTVSDDELFVLSREREPKTNQPGSRESTAPGTVKPKTSGEPSRRTLNVQ